MNPPGGPGGQDLDERDDRTLLAAHVEGDAEAFGVLFSRHRDRLWAVALRTTGDPEEAADALQDALVAAFRRAASFRGDAAVTTWLHRVVVNACLDRLRRRKVRIADQLPDDTEEYAGRGSVSTSTAPVGTTAGPRTDVADPLDLVVDRERRTAVLAALETLPSDQRAALVLVDMEGFSVDETAAILECAPGTIKSRCSRGRAKLLPLLQDLATRNPPGPSRVSPSTASGPATEPLTGGRADRPGPAPRGGDAP